MWSGILALVVVAILVYNCWKRVQRIIKNDAKQKSPGKRDNRIQPDRDE